jgi:hypothetical protein
MKYAAKVTTALYGDLFIVPKPPNDSGSMSLEFYTDAPASYTNQTELRSQMRALPRQAYTYEYDLPYVEVMAAWNTFFAGLRGQWAIPLWFEAQAVVSAAGQTVFLADTTVHDIRPNTLALLFDVRGNWELHTVSAIAAGVVTITGPTALVGRAWLMGVRIGYVSGKAPFKPTGRDNSVKVIYNVNDNDVLTGLTDAAPQFNGVDLYTAPYEIDGNATGTIDQQYDEVEFSVGGVAHATPWVQAQYTTNQGWRGFSVADLRAFCQWFYRRAGKFRAYYAPTFESNLRKASTGAVTTAFKVYDDNYLALVYPTCKVVAFGMRDGTWLLRNVTAAVSLGDGTTQLTLDTSLARNAVDVMVVSYVRPRRLDTDRVEINLRPAGYSYTSYNVVEVAA